MLSLRQWVAGSRPKTLLVGISGVLVGAFSALAALRGTGEVISVGPFVGVAVLCAVVAGFLQIAVNFANDYSDGIRGTDSLRAADSSDHTDSAGPAGSSASAETAHGPARLVASGAPPRAILAAAGISAAVACIAGLAAVVLTGQYWLIVLGAVCLLAAWFYTGGKHPYGYAGWGEVGVFLFFGLAVVLGTEYVLLGRVEGIGIFGALSQGCFAVCVMMVNNLRDIDTDAASGKRTLEVRCGRKRSLRLFLGVSLVGVLATAAMGLVPVSTERVGGAFSFVPVLLFLTVFVSMQSWKHTQLRQFRRALPLASLVCLLNAMVFGLVALFS